MGGDSQSNDDITRVLGDSAPALLATELPQGATFGRYVVVRKLGAGGMGVVYLAYDPNLDRAVALKVLHAGGSRGDRGAAQQRLLREAQVMAQLSHPNLVPVYDVGTLDEHVFVAMEFIEGGTLSQWSRTETRPWAQVLEIFIGAGQGLAAAHDAGVIHRDFKPDNVMVDRKERARVMDFGLARATEPGSPSDDAATGRMVRPDSDSSDSLASISVSTADSLTKTGIVLGTPAYMAPEQHMGEPLDFAADQFSFSVALYEALYGERPFAGNTAAKLCRAILDEQLQPPPAGREVPKGLRQIIVRGLAPNPAHRWPSMTAMLDALVQRQQRARRLRSNLPAVVLLGGLAGGSVWWQAQREQPCQGSEAALAELWNDQERQRLRSAFEATEVPYAPQAAERTTARIDRWGEQWVTHRRDACEATHVRHEQSDTALDLRMHCLAGRKRALEGLLSVLHSAEAGTVEHAISIVEQLPGPEHCDDLEALRSELPPPEDLELRERVNRSLVELGEVGALIGAARYPEARTAIDELDRKVADIDYPPLRVALGMEQGILLHSEGESEKAIELFRDTLWAAEAGGMDRTVAELALKLVLVLGHERDEFDRAESWVTMARAKLERIGNPPKILARLDRMLGNLADAKGDYEVAATHFEAALAYWQSLDPPSVLRARALGDYGKVHFRAGRMKEAAATFERAAELMAEVLGPEHPDVGKTLSNAAVAHHRMGDYDRARATFERTIEVLQAAQGPDHISLAGIYTNLAGVHYRLENYQEAIDAGRRSVAIKRARLGPEHPKIGLSVNNIALAQSKLGDHESALASYREASALLARLGPEHVSLIEPLIGEGEELLHLGRAHDAIAPLEKAFALQQTNDHEPVRLALPAYMLARALWDGGGDQARAVAVARRAAEASRDATMPEDRRLAERIETWLGEKAPADSP
ncbi:MAG: serine/threonine-protein kinase [Myxococcota bacterium]